MFWHLRTVFSNCLGSECVFSAEEWKVEQEQHLALVTENAPNMAFLFIYPAPPPTTPPLRSVACLCSANLCNVLSNDIIIALADILHCQTSKQYTGGWRNGFHYPHIHHPDEGFLFERGKRGRRGSCLDESEANCYV